jgi:hypothetical protein
MGQSGWCVVGYGARHEPCSGTHALIIQVPYTPLNIIYRRADERLADSGIAHRDSGPAGPRPPDIDKIRYRITPLRSMLIDSGTSPSACRGCCDH